MRGLNNFAQAGWYYHQIEQMGDGLSPTTEYGPLNALLAHFVHDTGRAIRRKFA